MEDGEGTYLNELWHQQNQFVGCNHTQPFHSLPPNISVNNTVKNKTKEEIRNEEEKYQKFDSRFKNKELKGKW